MKITDLPLQERPREKLLQRGACVLSNSELLAILLRQGTKQHSAIEMAHQLLQQFGSLRNVLQASYPEFSRLKGLGLSHYAQLQAALTLGQRMLQEALPEKLPLEGFTAL